MRSPRVVVYSLLLVVLLASAWATNAQAAPAFQEIYLPALKSSATNPPDDGPLHLDPQHDSGRAVAATIPLAGGEMVATAANGTRFTLTLPEGAIAQTTTVTLTPIAAIAGLPNVQLVGAVEIAPLNLWLLQAATLEIEPAQPIPVAQEYPFAYYGDGQDFHPYPILPYSEGLIFPIGKFDGSYGIAQEETNAGTAHAADTSFTPADPEARIRAQISVLIQAERERVQRGLTPDPTLAGKILDLLLELYDTTIKPLLPTMVIDCAFAEANMAKILSWLTTTTVHAGEPTAPGADARLAAAANAIMDTQLKATENCYRRAAAPCLDWADPEQEAKVLYYYRILLLLGAEGKVPALEDLPECIFVNVQLQGGQFHYEFPKDAEIGYDSSIHFQFTDEHVSSFGIFHPYFSPSQQALTPTAIVSITALIDDVWHTFPASKRFFCRDQKAERVQEVVITLAQTSGGEPLPPQVSADNIGCWRWTGSFARDMDSADPEQGVLEKYEHTNGQVTLERMEMPAYHPYASQGTLFIQPVGYRYVSGEIHHDEKTHTHYVDAGGKSYTCIKTITTTQTNLPSIATPSFPAMSVPNAGFHLPRKALGGLGSELIVNIPYQTSGDCDDPPPLDRIIVNFEGEISADGRRITLEQQNGNYHEVVNLEALRE